MLQHKQIVKNKHFKKVILILLIIFVLMPIVFQGVMLYRNGLNFPVWDEWGFAPMFEKAANGKLSINDLFSQVNESRKFFPKLIFLAVANLTNWNLRYEMGVIFLFSLIISINIFFISKKTINGSIEKKLFLYFLANLLIFSFIQYENIFWGIQISVFTPLVCLSSAMLIFYSNFDTKWKLIIGIILSFISTFSYVSGLLMWIVLFPLVFFSASIKDFLRKKTYIFIWIVFFFLTLNLYFFDYIKPSYHPSLSVLFQQPLNGLIFFFSFLGSPIGQISFYSRDFISPIIGFFEILIFAFVLYYFFKHFKNANLSKRMIGWIVIGAYALLTSCLTVIGRLGLGTEQAFVSRYTTPSLYLLVSIIFLVSIVYDDLKSKSNNSKKVFKSIMLFLIFILLLLHVLTSSLAVNTFYETNIVLKQSRGALLFANVINDENSLKELYFSNSLLMFYANTLDKLGYLNPSMLKTNKIQDLKGFQEIGNDIYGSFETFRCGEFNCTATGWAIFPNKKISVGSVVLSYVSDDGLDVVFAAADQVTQRRDIADLFDNKAYLLSGWSKTFEKDKILLNSTVIKAWAFDAESQEVFLLDGTNSFYR